VPTAPDYFSVMAIDSLATVLPKWIEWARKAAESEALKSASYPFPKPALKFLGTVIQRYRPRKGKPAAGFQTWMDQINARVREHLTPALAKHGAMFLPEVYEEAGVNPLTGYCLAEIADFNSLIAASQNHQTPVFALTESMLGHVGTVLEQDLQKRSEFRDTFYSLADRVVALAKHA
jgi:hypothetical protein